jgi:hypothetical protein
MKSGMIQLSRGPAPVIARFGIWSLRQVVWPVLWKSMLVSGLLFLNPTVGWAQSDNFDDGDDSGWTQYDPIAQSGLGGVGAWSFPNGNSYRLQSSVSPAPGVVGPSRVGSLRTDVSYTNFYMIVDVVNWDTNLDQAIGLVARVRQVGLGSTDGYSMTYQVADKNIQITSILDENPDPADPNYGTVPTTGDDVVDMVPGASYRFVFIGVGSQLTAKVFMHPDLTNPVADITGTDTDFTEGYCGLIAFDNSGGGGTTDVTFDNYFATVDEPKPPPAIVERDNFDDGDDAGWTQYDPIGTMYPGGVGTWSFPNSFPTGYSYRLQSVVSPMAELGPSRVGSLRQDITYTNFYLSVDVVNWNPNVPGQAIGLVARVREVGLGSTDGYAMTYQGYPNGDIDITSFLDENPDPADPDWGQVSTTGNDAFDMVPGEIYRFVFIGVGSQLTAKVFKHPDLIHPVADITGTDTLLTEGICGLIAFDNTGGGGTTDVTFDNYFATVSEPPTVKVEFTGFGDLFISWPTNAAGYILQGAFSLDDATNWVDIPPASYFWQEGSDRYIFSGDSGPAMPMRFYRLVLP